MVRGVLLLSALLLFLIGNGSAPAGSALEPGKPEDVAQGQELFKRLGCRACHARGGQGGNIGPALDKVGQRLSAADLRQQLTTPGRRQLRSRMPSYAFLKPAELQALINFLRSQP